jgi:hypothetical protein
LNIKDQKVLVLGGPGLVGIAVCRELLARGPKEIQIHSLRLEESEEARQQLLPEAGDCEITVSGGDIFGLVEDVSALKELWAQIHLLRQEHLDRFLLYRILTEGRPAIVIDCVNTATAIAYKDMYRSAEALWEEIDQGDVQVETAKNLLDSLYTPRLIRHVQILYRGMIDAGTGLYLKVGTSGTGGMGLNVPYTHSEEKPSRTLLSKTAVAGAHSMLLFLMARTPEAPIIKEIKPAAAIAWKRIEHGPVPRGREPIRMVDARPRPLGQSFSTVDPEAGVVTDEPLEAVFIDTGENGVFSMEEFAMLTTENQMEFVTPEEIAEYLVYEIEGGNTGHDIIDALDNSVMGPTYRAGMLRNRALRQMSELQGKHGTRSVSFEMLGPPHNTKLLFEAHLLREGFATMEAVREATPEAICERLNRLVRDQPVLANEIASIGIPVLLESGEIIRGPEVIVPAHLKDEPVTDEKLEKWVDSGWVDLRLDSCRRWRDRMETIRQEVDRLPEGDTSSRYIRNRRFWEESDMLQPGKVVAWILSREERGDRNKH